MVSADGDGMTRRNIVVISPHFDDVPLSLGESLRSGTLSGHRIRVRTVFGRTNWTSLMHPTPGRAPLVSLWRRLEESLASLVFGYRWSAANWPEVVLRTQNLDATSFLDAEVDLGEEPLVAQIRSWLASVAADAVDVGSRTDGRVDARWCPRRCRRRSGGRPDLLLVPSGLGGHLDHMIIAQAASDLLADCPVPIGFYEDRPYRSYVDDGDVALRIRHLVGDAESVAVSPPVRRGTQTRIRLCYPSQMTSYFREAMERDRAIGSAETVWFPEGDRPAWFANTRRDTRA